MCSPGQCATATVNSPTTAPTVPAAATPTQPDASPACFFLSLGWPTTQPGASIDNTYRFGSTQEGQREPHHGVEIPSHAGTPIVAPAAGRVEFAGEDRKEQLGPYTGFYGNVVVLALDTPPAEGPVLLLFGHLSKINVRTGQRVGAGDTLGLVGSSGVAIGAHLHFEVRVGANRYDAVDNPELWLVPRLADGGAAGVLAGRVVDRSGTPAHGQQVTVRRLDNGTNGPRTYFLDTYDFEADTPGSNRVLRENFVLSGLPPGDYEVAAFSPSLRQQRVHVVAGVITWVAFEPGETPPACAR
jgi:murein DD-endopeptidase MepM/ murein hydrolase activator NlpD